MVGNCFDYHYVRYSMNCFQFSPKACYLLSISTQSDLFKKEWMVVEFDVHQLFFIILNSILNCRTLCGLQSDCRQVLPYASIIKSWFNYSSWCRISLQHPKSRYLFSIHIFCLNAYGSNSCSSLTFLLLFSLKFWFSSFLFSWNRHSIVDC